MIKIDPYAYQREGVKQIEHKFDCRVLLADDPGLGKTIQTLLWKAKYLRRRMKKLKLKGPTVVVCPAIAKYEWERIGRDQFGLRLEILSGREPVELTVMRKKVRMRDRIFVINYDILGDPRLKQTNTWVAALKKLKPALLVIDEVHMVKDRSTIRYRAVKALSKGIRHIIAISGTPAENCPAEFWPALNILRPDVFDSFWSFGHEFCGPKRVPWRQGWEFKGATRIPKLNRLLLKTCMIRRRKEDVLKDLPAKTRNVIPVDISNRKEYDAAEKDLIKWLIKNKKRTKALRAVGNERLLRVGYLKRLAAELKLKACVEWIDTFLRTTGRKLIVFGIHRKVLDKICSSFKGLCVKVDGSVTGRRRQAATKAFNEDNRIRLFVGNVKAAGTAWSCTSASDVVFVELPWTPGTVTQAEDRIHGIGRGKKGIKVMIHFLVAHGTLEERLVKMLHDKQRALGRILDGKRAGGFEILDKLEAALTNRRAA